MDAKILFKERQRFTQWWLWLILLLVDGLLLFGVFKQVIGGEAFGEKPLSDIALILVVGLTLLLTVLFVAFCLETRITQEGIYVKFFPFHLSFRHYSWKQISKSFLRQYNPISEYGGWGVRYGLFGKGKAFNVSGNNGLQLEFSDNKSLLIGTNKPDELKQALEEIGQLKQ